MWTLSHTLLHSSPKPHPINHSAHSASASRPQMQPTTALRLDLLTYKNRPTSKEKIVQDPTQCFGCSQYVHVAAHCRQKVLEHCAGPHHTRTCSCLTPSACVSQSSCLYIIPKCAACGGVYWAMGEDCPERLKQYEAAI